jgi:hypothetical protein
MSDCAILTNLSGELSINMTIILDSATPSSETFRLGANYLFWNILIRKNSKPHFYTGKEG